MTIDDLKKESLYANLTEKQKTYLVAVCTGTSETDAAKQAWPNCTTDDSVRAMVHKARKHPALKILLNKWRGKGTGSDMPTRDDMVRYLWERALDGKCDDQSVAKFAQIITELQGWRTKPADAPKPDSPVITDGEDEFDIDAD